MTTVRLDLKADLYGRSADDIARKTFAVERRLERLRELSRSVDTQLDSVGGSFRRAARGVVAFGTGLVGLRAADRSFAALRDIERGVVAVGKTTGLAGTELRELGSDILALSADVPVLTRRLLEISEVAGQLGINDAPNILEFTDTLAKLELATNIAGEGGAQRLARVAIFSAEGIEGVQALGAAITDLGNNTPAFESAILQIGEKVGQGLQEFGPSGSFLVGLSATFRQFGVEAELAGSTAQRVFKQLDDTLIEGLGSRRLATLSDLLGLDQNEVVERYRGDVEGLFLEFIRSLGELRSAGGSTTAILEDFSLKTDRFNRSLPALTNNYSALIGNIARGNAQLDLAGTEFDALNIEASKVVTTIAGASVLFSNTFDRAVAEGTGGATVSIRKFIEASSEAISILAGLTDEEEEASDAGILLASSVEAVAAAIGVLALSSLARGVVALASFRKGTLLATLATQGFNAAIKANPVGAFLTVFSIAVTSFIAWNTRSRDATESQKEFNEEIDEGRDRLDRLTSSLTRFTDARIDRNAQAQAEALRNVRIEVIDLVREAETAGKVDVDLFSDSLIGLARKFPEARSELTAFINELDEIDKTAASLSASGLFDSEDLGTTAETQKLNLLRGGLEDLFKLLEKEITFADRESIARIRAEEYDTFSQALERANADLQEEIDFLSQSNAERIFSTALRRSEVDLLNLSAEAREALTLRTRELSEELDRVQRAEETGAQTGRILGQGLQAAVTDVENLDDALENLLRRLGELAFSATVTNPLSGFFGSLFASVASSATPGAPGSDGLPPPSSNNINLASADGNILGFQSGGFPEIIGGPIGFPISGGRAGIAGEQGKEVGIAPLNRDVRTGRLGVDITNESRASSTTVFRIGTVSITGGNTLKDSLGKTAKQLSRSRRRSLN